MAAGLTATLMDMSDLVYMINARDEEIAAIEFAARLEAVETARAMGNLPIRICRDQNFASPLATAIVDIEINTTSQAHPAPIACKHCKHYCLLLQTPSVE